MRVIGIRKLYKPARFDAIVYDPVGTELAYLKISYTGNENGFVRLHRFNQDNEGILEGFFSPSD